MSQQTKAQARIGWILVTPALVIFALIIFYPFVNSILTSFTDKNLIYAHAQFIGLLNYKKLFADPNTLKLIWITIKFVFFATFFPFLLGLIWALLLNQKFKGSGFIQGLTLIDWVIPGIAIGFLWSWIFNGDYGILNAFLVKIGSIDKNIIWLGGKQTSMIAVVTARTWQMFPWFMAFTLGGLQEVPKELCEAATIDGANNWKVFTNVIIPSIKPVLILILILGTISNLQHFDLIMVMTGGGPERSTSTFATQVYQTAFKQYNLGRAAALGVIWALLLGLFSSVYLKKINED